MKEVDVNKVEIGKQTRGTAGEPSDRSQGSGTPLDLHAYFSLYLKPDLLPVDINCKIST